MHKAKTQASLTEIHDNNIISSQYLYKISDYTPLMATEHCIILYLPMM